ncbi:uncharacterized protein PHACADRAFT_203317 [Phanerochaete carnosa HHB-10118-sp]|uniref:Uncharacterized protein n=1 Tax=Phanerochaete carnosa (strain HHB-10118-sp) TaxID=650164 RepID=K5UF19_PHACS|nr:uncharacterized protein PHACADRAFT_201700 [Phanerochaete carnosa HHB-10118-sp]XP_007403397.1 uncharacterized protein PHACADRAFT_203317 [Phanerochaete carnosa HHB-10118-sp]EKM48051.1 hypothetical protein PHACADRAFT_203317 [Phanerochaete carnosa HHB-10118-sp]EKM49442.1 hypothetical protein PHACADRAFT_201700 [Phanerochaete carnosa HHB-10118-sp]
MVTSATLGMRGALCAAHAGPVRERIKIKKGIFRLAHFMTTAARRRSNPFPRSRSSLLHRRRTSLAQTRDLTEIFTDKLIQPWDCWLVEIFQNGGAFAQVNVILGSAMQRSTLSAGRASFGYNFGARPGERSAGRMLEQGRQPDTAGARPAPPGRTPVADGRVLKLAVPPTGSILALRARNASQRRLNAVARRSHSPDSFVWTHGWTRCTAQSQNQRTHTPNSARPHHAALHNDAAAERHHRLQPAARDGQGVHLRGTLAL